MKKISLARACALVLGLALGAASCEQPSENLASGNGSYGVTPADPVIVGTGTHTSGSGKNIVTYYDIWVMNSDGSNKTNVYSSTNPVSTPSWSASGGKVVWREAFTLTKGKNSSQVSRTFHNIRTGTVSVSNGTPTMSSISTLVPAISGNDSTNWAAVKWSSSSTDEIALWGYPYGFNSKTITWKVKMVDPSNGTTSDLWQAGNGQTLTGQIAFNYDGSKIMIGTKESGNNFITILDRASGTVEGVICNGWTAANPVNGSHAGADQLLLIGQETSNSTATGYIYDFSASTMTQLPNSTTYSAFSTDNAKVTRNGSNNAGTELYTLNGGATTQLASAGRSWDWKR